MDGQLVTKQAVDEQGQHSSTSNVHEGFPVTSNKTVLKRRSCNPPELQKATEQMQNALQTINTVLINKSTQKEDVCNLYGNSSYWLPN